MPNVITRSQRAADEKLGAKNDNYFTREKIILITEIGSLKISKNNSFKASLCYHISPSQNR